MKTRGLVLVTWLMTHPHAIRFALMALWLVGAVFQLANPPAGGGSPS